MFILHTAQTVLSTNQVSALNTSTKTPKKDIETSLFKNVYTTIDTHQTMTT